METSAELIKAALPNGVYVYVRATIIESEEEVAFDTPTFKGVTDAIGGIAESITTTLQKVKPQKACVEFGVEVALEAGQLTALLVKGSGTSNLKVTLEWGAASAE